MAQIFPDPDGGYGSFKGSQKEINKCDDHAWAGVKKDKSNTSNRRYKFNIAFWDECWTHGASVDSDCSDSCNAGWNKAGRISFMRANNTNRNKLHLGWKYHDKMENQLKLSAYFHETYNSNLDHCYVSHYISTKPTDNYLSIDMFLGLEIIALIVENKALGIRKPNWIPEPYSSFLMRTFYFGEKSKDKKCAAPETLTCKFINQWYDSPNYWGYFNDCDTMVWNITEFDSDDKAGFYANHEVHGSVAKLGDVQYHSDHPNPVKQKCQINSGAEITFASGKKIVLNPGFHAKPGSHFHAVIDQCFPLPSMGNLPSMANLTLSGYQVCYSEIFNSEFYGFDLYKDDELKFSESGSISSSNLCFDIGYVWPGSYDAYLTLSNECDKELVVPAHKILFLASKDSINSSESDAKSNIVGVPEKNQKSNQKGSHDDNPLVDTFVKIFPNPNPGIFTIKLHDFETEDFTTEISNMFGETIYQKQTFDQNSFAVDISEHPKGIYFVKIRVGDQLFIKKVIYH
ncbi:MAG: T9SS type A sorting domain-containing protein [Bacteroidales bacterium]|nr:T9SS type A sorting domain-containing protein [Bacteroidales bacterium]MCF8404042.1 T9SS type A sorting domain-containing protein [Bacteroidales bacterium]